MLRYYIATVWHASSVSLSVDGYSSIKRYIQRAKAENEHAFMVKIRDLWLHDVDALVEFGPVSISKDQGELANEPNLATTTN